MKFSQTPTAFDPRVVLGIARMDHSAGRLSDAQRGYRTVLSLDPDEPDALHLLGVIETQLGCGEQAVELIARATQIKPEAAQYQRSLGSALKSVNRAGEAAQAFLRSLTLEPASFESFAGLTGCVAELGIETAEKSLRREANARSLPKDRSISVITCSVEDAKHRRIREHYEGLLAGTRFEIIQLTDARSLCEAYNRGVARSSGDIVVFSHDDIKFVSDDFAARLTAHFESYDVVGLAGTSRLTIPGWSDSGWPNIHGCVAQRLPNEQGVRCDCFGPWTGRPAIQGLDGVFFAVSREVCRAIPFDEVMFDGFHFYDLDFTYRAFAAGFRLAVAWDILAIHDSFGSLDAVWLKYAKKFAEKYRGLFPMKNAVEGPRVSAQFANEADASTFHRRMSTMLINPLATSECFEPTRRF